MQGNPCACGCRDAIWQALLTGWRVVDPSLELLDRHGAPLDLRRHYGPLDDPLAVAHFLREAGFVHLRGWLDPTDMATIGDDIDAALPNYRHGDGRSWWATTNDGAARCVRLQHCFEHSPTTHALLRSETWDRLRHHRGHLGHRRRPGERDAPGRRRVASRRDALRPGQRPAVPAGRAGAHRAG